MSSVTVLKQPRYESTRQGGYRWNILWEQSGILEHMDVQDSILTYGLGGIANTMKLQGLNAQNSNYINLLPISVAGINMMLPRDRVRCVIDWKQRKLTENDTNILLDVHNYNGKKLLVFDTTVMVIPKEHPNKASFLRKRKYQKLVVFDSGKWGLVCDGIDEDVILNRADVVWRKSIKKHGWLAGMLPKHGYSLIDVDRFYVKARHYQA